MKKWLAVVVILLTSTAAIAADKTIPEKLQEISVTIDTGHGSGSGTLFNREVNGTVVTYVWTAAHVIDGLRKTRVVIVDGSPKTVVEFNDAKLVQEFRENGRRIGESRMEAKVIRYSDAERGEDLALLEVRKRNFVPASTTAVFYLSKDIPQVGTKLRHVGSLLGQVGANSYTEGVVSQIGRVIDELGANGVVFDQTTVTAFPGSSGGGVYDHDGKYVGMLVRGAGEQFNLIVPVRRMRDWAKAASVEWAIDPSLPYPGTDDLKKLPIEETGVGESFGHECKSYPTLLKRAHYKDPISINDREKDE